MAHILVNAMSLRPGGGLQVIMGLLSRFSDSHTYTVIWSDHRSYEILSKAVQNRNNVTFDCPIGVVGNARLFLWQMTKFRGYCAAKHVDLVLSVNFHYPLGEVPQVIYHLSMLRFERERRAIWKSGEVQDRLRDWRAHSAVSSASSNVFESHYLQGLAEERWGNSKNPSVIYIGIDDEAIAAISEREGRSFPLSPDILAITSPQPHKDNATLIRMLAELLKIRPSVSWRLRVAGGRPGAFDDLVQLADELGVDKHIDWLGFVSHDDLVSIAETSLCLVSASIKESFCMVALEAMSWGCPAVVADTTSMPESVGDAGLLAKPSDPADFAARVVQLFDNVDLRSDLVKRGFARARMDTWREAATKFEAVFADLL